MTGFFVLLVCASAGVSAGTPSELKQAFMQRGDFRSARFVYTYEEKNPPLPISTKRIESTIVGSDVLLVDRGDEDEIRLRDPQNGKPLLGVRGACLPEYRLISRGSSQTWKRYDSVDWVGLHEGEVATVYSDPRIIGLAPWTEQNCSVDEALERLDSLPVVEWKKRMTEDRCIITAWLKNDSEEGYAYEWVLDPARDMAALEFATIKRESDRETRGVLFQNEYRRVDNVWWPSRINITYGGGMSRAVEFKHVEFNRKNHPKKLTPDDMGVPIGAPVRKAGTGPLSDHRYAGDGLAVAGDEFNAMAPNLDLTAYDRFRSEQAALGGGYYPSWWHGADGCYGIDKVGRDWDTWEMYVRRWKLRHSIGVDRPIDQKQMAAADAVLKDCRRRALNIVEATGRETGDIEQSNRKIERIFAELKQRLEQILATGQHQSDPKGESAPRITTSKPSR